MILLHSGINKWALRVVSWVILVAPLGWGMEQPSSFSSPLLRPNRNDVLLLPCEIVWDSHVRAALQILRRNKNDTDAQFVMETTLRQCALSQQTALLTMVGYKGGNLYEQINQDRAFVHVRANEYSVSGVMDGHGTLGHFVAEWCRYELLLRLTTLDLKDQPANEVVKLLSDLVIGMDRDIPQRYSQDGGATASFVFQHVNKLYFCNTGDSQSFLVAAIVQHNQLQDVNIAFATKLHSPTDPQEKERLEAAGMRVVLEEGESRAWYTTESGQSFGLAMSRALGDHDAKPGIIADPSIDVVDVDEVIASIVQKGQTNQDCQEILPDGTTVEKCESVSAEDIRLFVVSVTDGIIDYLKLDAIAYQLAQGFYEENKQNVVSSAADIIHQAAGKWQEAMNGLYRDDIAIVVTKVT